MLGRFLQPLPLGTSRRAYSFFSSKPGGGRYFNSAKPHKVAPVAATANAKARPDDPTSPTSSSSPEESSSKALDQDDTSLASPLPVFPPETSPAPAPRLPPHATFSGNTYPLHQFLSLHRPLLLVPLPTSTLFETPVATFDEATALAPPENALPSSVLPFGEAAETPVDADADAARQLARALAMNHVGGWIDWKETLARLGDTGALEALQTSVPFGGVNMDSVKRKRRKKMSKHKCVMLVCGRMRFIESFPPAFQV
ncbi:hypothetical protein K439DRAFT_943756 [Ramaria rubella]|nr:hypothetical protein K439DRAFT_943756 [Ramaria rubella]